MTRDLKESRESAGTDLSELRKRAPFRYGRLVKIHDVGERYSVVEFLPFPKTKKVKIEEKCPEFMAYIDGAAIGSIHTLEEAFVLSFAYGNLRDKSEPQVVETLAKAAGLLERRWSLGRSHDAQVQGWVKRCSRRCSRHGQGST